MSLENAPKIRQDKLMKNYKFAINAGHNIIVHGPSGSGKTEMALQAVEETGLNAVYVNLSVKERPDIQGLPKLSENKMFSEYAPPAELPLAESQFYQEKNTLERGLSILSGKDLEYATNRLKEIEIAEKQVQRRTLAKFMPKGFEKISHIENDSVIVFDEADKGTSEIQQPLLEILQFRSISGRPLNIKACILTGNLPDENCYSKPLSHALTNRCMIFELQPDLKIWQRWARDSGIHPLILGFLASKQNSNLFIKPPGVSSLYHYAYPTPRSWTVSSNLLTQYENFLKKSNESKDIHFMTDLISSKVGVEAGLKFKVWLQVYKELDPTIDAIIKGEKVAKLKDFNTTFICAITLCSILHNEAQKEIDAGKVVLRTTNDKRPLLLPNSKTQLMGNVILNWLNEQDSEVQAAALRTTFSKITLGSLTSANALGMFKKLGIKMNEVNLKWKE